MGKKGMKHYWRKGVKVTSAAESGGAGGSASPRNAAEIASNVSTIRAPMPRTKKRGS